MALRKVASMGNPVLRKVAAPVPVSEIKSEKIQQLIQDMVETMFEYDGRGLAAPQVHESLQIVVVLWDFDEGKEPYLRAFINPVIKPLTEKTMTTWEGCLSVPGLRGKVSRPDKISVECYDQNGKKLSFVAEGYSAIVIQHEVDHLLGKLYVDRITDIVNGFAFNREFQRYLAGDDVIADDEGDED